MGLFKFLKEKFGKKKDNEEKVEEQVASFEPEEKPEEVVPESTPVVEEVKEETKVEEPIPVVEEPKEELKVEEEPAPVIQQQMAEEKPAPVVEQPKVEVKKEEPKEPKIEKKPEVREEKKETKTYIKGMEKSRENFANKIEKLSKKYKKVNQEYFEQLEEILIEADVGVNLTLSVIDQVINESKAKKIDDADSINELVIDTLFEDYAKSGVDVQNDVRFQDEGTTVLLVAGVNGVGKTTTIAKLANRYIKQGKKVMLCAADTFRAGAIEQLTIWAERLGCPIVVGKPESDPASVAFEGARRAKQEGIDLLIVDTAGRLQNKINLMNELAKISKVISKEIPNSPHEVFLVIDATTGQNGVVQAKQFLDCIKLTGIVITKMDGTSKGGIILAIRDELGIPVRFIGLGEGMDDLQEFDLEKYLVGLLIGD